MNVPECEKMARVKIASQSQGLFLEWLLHNKRYVKRIGAARNKNIEQLLAEYHGIDLNKVEEERRALLEEIRGQK